jgi:hypothetical protein
VAGPEDLRLWLTTDGIRFLATIEPAFQHLLAIREISPNGALAIGCGDSGNVGGRAGLVIPIRLLA